MAQYNKVLVFITAFFLSLGVFAQESKTLFWEDLLPQIDTIEDPFEALTLDQMYDLSTIAEFKHAQTQPDFEPSEAQLTEVKQAREQLKLGNVDVDYLFSMREKIAQQRKALATQPNTQALNGKRRIPGYITPLETDGSKVTQFFLVPTAGACIHTPPPPPNQLVLVTFPEGVELPSLETPFWVEGELISELTEQTVNYYDGASDVKSVYQMDASTVELYL
ncbi:DUF3299 domain-containing protein [Vibrio sp. SCSIO 43135]|uniref:DUF3299 domain-containing protein n=1 Tax=Vibrio sp. SCSIO 43135 TaxID=2819096 RepID=UPI002075C70D|nr:DUF3299 domain-containing protein [Vibrio sp. SCSIO 43135]USD43080.1 DUF3299 domain-containing protein [Vibrio sp. SCSIO 43135]